MTDSPAYLTFDDLAERWQLCRAAVFALAKNDQDFPTRVRFTGRTIRFELGDVLRYEQAKRVTGEAVATA